jgi:hypothetical protein
MLKRILIFVGLVLPIGAGTALWLLWGRAFVVELGQRELQSALEKGFPVEETYLLVLKLDLSQPTVTLQEHSDRIGLAAKVRVGFLDTSASLRGTAEVSCLVRYDAARGAFFAEDPRVERLLIDGHPQSQHEMIKAAITGVLKGVFDQTPVYTLGANDVRQSIAKLVLKDVRVKNGKLRFTLGVGN